MLAPHLNLVGFSACEWNRLLEAFRPADAGGARVEGTTSTGSGGVVIVTEGKQPIKLLSTWQGRLNVRDQVWPVALPELAARHGARWAMHLQFGALQLLFDRFADGIGPDDDYLTQVLSLMSLVRQFEAEGRLRVWPQSLSQWPIPSQKTALRALDALCPAGQSLLLGVFRRGELYTAIALRRGERGFDRIVGPHPLRTAMGLVSGDWTRDYRYLLGAAEQCVGPVCVGCFAELHTLQALAGSRRRGTWTEAIAMREVILSPVVPALAIPLSIDVGMAAIETVRTLAERARTIDWLAPAGPLGALFGKMPLGALVDKVQSATVPSLKSMLGFDPLALMYKLVEKRTPRE